jgi:hypothetical protein
MATKRREIGEVEACVPLASDAGVEAEVDWGQAQVLVRGEAVDVHLFLMGAGHSGAVFVTAFRAETPIRRSPQRADQVICLQDLRRFLRFLQPDSSSLAYRKGEAERGGRSEPAGSAGGGQSSVGRSDGRHWGGLVTASGEIRRRLWGEFHGRRHSGTKPAGPVRHGAQTLQEVRPDSAASWFALLKAKAVLLPAGSASTLEIPASKAATIASTFFS